VLPYLCIEVCWLWFWCFQKLRAGELNESNRTTRVKKRIKVVVTLSRELYWMTALYSDCITGVWTDGTVVRYHAVDHSSYSSGFAAMPWYAMQQQYLCFSVFTWFVACRWWLCMVRWLLTIVQVGIFVTPSEYVMFVLIVISFDTCLHRHSQQGHNISTLSNFPCIQCIVRTILPSYKLFYSNWCYVNVLLYHMCCISFQHCGWLLWSCLLDTRDVRKPLQIAWLVFFTVQVTTENTRLTICKGFLMSQWIWSIWLNTEKIVLSVCWLVSG